MKSLFSAWVLFIAFQPTAQASGWTSAKCSSATGQVVVDGSRVVVESQVSYIAPHASFADLMETGGRTQMGIFARADQALKGQNQQGSIELKTLKIVGSSVEPGCTELQSAEAVVELSGSIVTEPVKLLCDVKVIVINNECER